MNRTVSKALLVEHKKCANRNKPHAADCMRDIPYATGARLLFSRVAGHDDAVNFLLRHFRHVHIDQCNKLGFTALMKAAIQGRTRCAKLLLFAGNYLQ